MAFLKGQPLRAIISACIDEECKTKHTVLRGKLRKGYSAHQQIISTLMRAEDTLSTNSAEDDLADSPVPLANANAVGSSCALPEKLSLLAEASNGGASQAGGRSCSSDNVCTSDKDNGLSEFPPRAAQSRERAAIGMANSPVRKGESEEERSKRLLYCSLCKVAANSQSQLDAHNKGSKHKMMLEARNGGGAIKAFPRLGSRPSTQDNTPKGSGLQDKTFYCEICDVHVNSETQLKQHITSRRHKDRIAGKPIKPKFSPYNKIQGRSSSVGGKLPPGFLPTSLASVRDPLGLHEALSAAPPPASPLTTLFHVAAPAPPLLRAAPGPIRSSHRSMLFTPY